MEVRQAYLAVRDRVNKQFPSFEKQGTLVAASKGQSIKSILELVKEAHRDFGENYVQELVEKDDTLKKMGVENIRWHFIGHLQSNKVALVVPRVSVIHSVDSMKLASRIQRFSEESDKVMQIFVQVNIDQEANKSGVLPSEVEQFLKSLREMRNLQVLGLMCIPQQGDTEDAFRRMKLISDRVKSDTEGKLSMGMTQDYLSALACGSTHIRVGTAIFGERKPKLLSGKKIE